MTGPRSSPSGSSPSGHGPSGHGPGGHGPGAPRPSGPSGGASAQGPAGTGSPWWAVLPEIIIAAAAAAATAAAGYAVAGPAAFAVVAVAAGVLSLLVLRSLIRPPSLAGSPEDTSGPDPAVPAPVLSTFSRQWRRRSRLADAQASMTAYEAGLRGQLQNLLASRLGERHGISLYDDPDAARRVFAGDSRGYDSLWPWIDPARPIPPDQPRDQPGIPFRTLARLLDRLEQL